MKIILIILLSLYSSPCSCDGKKTTIDHLFENSTYLFTAKITSISDTLILEKHYTADSLKAEAYGRRYNGHAQDSSGHYYLKGNEMLNVEFTLIESYKQKSELIQF